MPGDAGSTVSSPLSAPVEGGSATVVHTAPLPGSVLLPVADRPTKLLEIFENQRRLTTFRPYSTADLLPLDPGCWSDEAGATKYLEMDLVPLPPPPAPMSGGGGVGGGAAAGEGGGGIWQWLDAWRLTPTAVGRAATAGNMR